MQNNFRVLLAKQKLKISDVSKSTGISRSTLVSFYYERDVDIRLSTLIKLANYLHVSIDELIYWVWQN